MESLFRFEPENDGDGCLCHDSFRAAKEARRRQHNDKPEERELWLADAVAEGGRRTTVRLCGGVILDVFLDDTPPPPPSAVVIECRGRLHVLPGLIDAHVHCTAVVADLAALRSLPPSLVAARAAVVLGGMLMRGFTTVRDAGGADYGLAAAVDEGSILGPRILYSGRALSQTGGHGDMRPLGAEALESTCPCACACAAGIGRVCDGADAVRKAAREELRLGGHWIKLMASGGVSSPTDALEQPQFSRAELKAACEEATARGAYAGAHAYMPQSIRRAVAAGARSVEHGNFLDGDSAAEMAVAGAFLVPTLITYTALVEQGLESGFPAALIAKAQSVADAGAQSLAVAKRAGVRVCFGSDLLGPMHAHQSREFALRLSSGVFTAEELIEQATANCAALFGEEGRRGRVAAGFAADLVLTWADPCKDLLGALVGGAGGRGVALVIKEGLVAKAPTLAFGDAVNRGLFDRGGGGGGGGGA